MKWSNVMFSAGVGLLLLSACGGTSAPPAGTAAASSPAVGTSSSAGPSPAKPVASSSATGSTAGSSAPASSAGQPQPTTEITVALVGGSPSTTPIYVGADQGIFEKYGLRLKLTGTTATVAMAGLLSGNVQVAVDGGAAVQADPTGTKLAFIAALVNEFAIWQLAARPEIHSVADLKGKTIAGGTPTDSGTLTTRAILKQAGLNPDTDVKWLWAETPAGRWTALKNGNIAATLLTWPLYLQAKQAGLNLLVDTKSLHLPGAATTLSVSREWLKSHETLAESFLKAEIEATALADSNPTIAKQAIAKHVGDSDPAHLDDAYQRFHGVWPNPPYITKEAVAEAIADLQSPEAKKHQPEDFIDNGPLDAVVKSGFAKPFLSTR